MTDREKIADLLRAQSTLALATVSVEGTPHATPVFYIADDDLALYWFSSPSSLHSQNLAANPLAAGTIHRDTTKWKEILGAQLRGQVSLVNDPDLRKQIEHCYCDRFELGKLLRAAIAASHLYVLRPTWIRLIDNSTLFGSKTEINLS